MNAEPGWRTLQLYLNAARAARDAGDRALALQKVEAALAIDPEYLAAQVLRDSMQAPAPAAASAPQPSPALRDVEAYRHPSSDAYAGLEERARRRRIDRCLGVARLAIVEGRVPEASSAVDELTELGADLPAVQDVSAELAALRRDASRRQRAWWLGTAAVLLGALATRLAVWPGSQELALLRSQPMVSVAPLVTPPMPAVLVRESTEASVDSPIVSLRDAPAAFVGTASQGPTLEADASQVRDTLDRYRRAYNGMDAPLAHAVYPVLDQAALAHAFDTMRSQSLVFDACTIDVREASARAVCRGSARFVSKTARREIPAERRVWTFTLGKNGDGDWTIASARSDH